MTSSVFIFGKCRHLWNVKDREKWITRVFANQIETGTILSTFVTTKQHRHHKIPPRPSPVSSQEVAVISQLQCDVHIHIDMWEDFCSSSNIIGPETLVVVVRLLFFTLSCGFSVPGIKPRASLSLAQPLESCVCYNSGTLHFILFAEMLHWALPRARVYQLSWQQASSALQLLCDRAHSA